MSVGEIGTVSEQRSAVRETVFSESLWESQMGYARGVRVGNQVYIAGTVASDGEGNAQGEDAYTQTDFIIRKIQRALKELGADLHGFAVKRVKPSGPPGASGSSVAIAFKSAPAQNAWSPAPVSTSTRVSSSAQNASKWPSSAAAVAPSIALRRSGRSIVSSAAAPRRS